MDEPATRPARAVPTARAAPAPRDAAAWRDPEAALAAAEQRLRALRGAAFGGAGGYDPDAFDAALLAQRAALARAAAARRGAPDSGRLR
jgi:hypothetical protein